MPLVVTVKNSNGAVGTWGVSSRQMAYEKIATGIDGLFYAQGDIFDLEGGSFDVMQNIFGIDQNNTLITYFDYNVI